MEIIKIVIFILCGFTGLAVRSVWQGSLDNKKAKQQHFKEEIEATKDWQELYKASNLPVVGATGAIGSYYVPTGATAAYDLTGGAGIVKSDNNYLADNEKEPIENTIAEIPIESMKSIIDNNPIEEQEMVREL